MERIKRLDGYLDGGWKHIKRMAGCTSSGWLQRIKGLDAPTYKRRRASQLHFVDE